MLQMILGNGVSNVAARSIYIFQGKRQKDKESGELHILPVAAIRVSRTSHLVIGVVNGLKLKVLFGFMLR